MHRYRVIRHPGVIIAAYMLRFARVDAHPSRIDALNIDTDSSVAWTIQFSMIKLPWSMKKFPTLFIEI